jgi:la-related protein 1
MSPVSLGNPGALDANPENEAPVRSPAARRALMMPSGDALEKSIPSPELSPAYVPNARGNGSDHHQNGRFGSHPHGRGGSYGGGNRRGNGGGGGRRGNEHHGAFDGQRRGGGRRDGHGPSHQQHAHQPTYIRTRPPLSLVAGAPPPPPPFMSAVAPQTPPYGAPMGFPGILRMCFVRSDCCYCYISLICFIVNDRYDTACLLFRGTPLGRHSRPTFCASSDKSPGYFN